MGMHLTYMVSLIGQMSSHQRPRNRFNNLLACKRNWSNVSRDKGHGDSLRMLHIGHRLYMHSFRSNILRKTGCYNKQTFSDTFLVCFSLNLIWLASMTPRV